MDAEWDLSGISFLDHTADVGLEVVARSLPDLFTRMAAGMASLLLGVTEDPPDQGSFVERSLELEAEDMPTLLRAWLRALLHWYEVEGLVLRTARFGVLADTRLSAALVLVPDARPPVREIKGVTLHGLVAERRSDGWLGRVIFDV